jgi:dihydrofolate reductase
MRKVIVCNIISLDGQYTGADGDVMAMPFDQGFSDYNAERLRSASTLLLGRASFEGFRDYWPPVQYDENQPEVEREISRLTTNTEKVVVSDTLSEEGSTGWGEARVVPRADAHHEVAELRKGEGGDILVFGSHVLWNDLLAHGLVDELHLMIGPGTLGTGIPAFDTATTLRLIDSPRTWDDSSLVLLRYAVSSAAVQE